MKKYNEEQHECEKCTATRHEEIENMRSMLKFNFDESYKHHTTILYKVLLFILDEIE